MKKISNDVYMSELPGVPGINSLITFADGGYRENEDFGPVGKYEGRKSGEKYEIKKWGADNATPQRREHLLSQSNIVPTLISTKKDITIGTGVMVYTERHEDGKKVIDQIDAPAEIAEFLDRLDDHQYFDRAAGEYYKHCNVFTELVATKGGKVDTLNVLACKHTRAEKKNAAGRINRYLVSPEWVKDATATQEGARQIAAIEAFISTEDFKLKNQVMHIGDPMLCGDGYYFTPAYWAGRAWIELANSIPIFHKNNLLNSFTIKYHIQFPKDFFSKAPSANMMAAGNEEQRIQAEENARTDFIDSINEWLAGPQNTGRAFFSSYDASRALGKEFAGIKITPLKVDLLDKALLDLFERSNQANISAQAIHPTLASVETQGKLSAGSEIRNALLVYSAIKAPTPRRHLLKPLKMVQKINGWAEYIKFGFQDIELTRLDKNPAGIQPAEPQTAE